MCQKFTRWSADEVISGLRTKIGFPALLIELYEVELASLNVFDIKQKTKGAFTVIEHAKPNDFNDEQLAFEVTEAIVYDILKKMWQDHYGPAHDRCTTPFRRVDFNSMNIVPVGPLFQNEFGYRVEFDFELQQTIDITVAPAAGTFIS